MTKTTRAGLQAAFSALVDDPTAAAVLEQVAQDLQRKGYVGKTIGIKLRFDDFSIVTRDHTLPHYTDSAAGIRAAAGQCLKRAPLAKRLRLLGVRVGSLISAQDAKLLPSPLETLPHDTNALLFPDD